MALLEAGYLSATSIPRWLYLGTLLVMFIEAMNMMMAMMVMVAMVAMLLAMMVLMLARLLTK